MNKYNELNSYTLHSTTLFTHSLIHSFYTITHSKHEMASLKEVRNRIISVNSTQQITKAMKMVAAAKLRRAQDNIIQMRPYAQKLGDMLATVRREAKPGLTAFQESTSGEERYADVGQLGSRTLRRF